MTDRGADTSSKEARESPRSLARWILGYEYFGPVPYTPLESLYLFREVFARGFNTAAFEQISERLTNNKLIQNGATYDPRRLTPDGLANYFLQLLWDELRTDTEKAQAALQPDGELSPASKKRKLQPPPRPTLKDVRRQHLEKVVAIANRLEIEYRDHAIRTIREEEARFDQLQAEIIELEKEEQRLKEKAAEAVPSGQNGVSASKEAQSSDNVNGSLSPSASQEGPRAVNSVPQQIASNKPGPVVQSNATGQSQAAQPPAAHTVTRPSEPVAPSNGTAVLQPPRGVSPFLLHTAPRHRRPRSRKVSRDRKRPPGFGSLQCRNLHWLKVLLSHN